MTIIKIEIRNAFILNLMGIMSLPLFSPLIRLVVAVAVVQLSQRRSAVALCDYYRKKHHLVTLAFAFVFDRQFDRFKFGGNAHLFDVRPLRRQNEQMMVFHCVVAVKFETTATTRSAVGVRATAGACTYVYSPVGDL